MAWRKTSNQQMIYDWSHTYWWSSKITRGHNDCCLEMKHMMLVLNLHHQRQDPINILDYELKTDHARPDI